MASVEKFVKYMEKIAKDDKHGYDQTNRYGPDYDCSSLASEALKQAGFKVSKFSTTRTIKDQLLKDGWIIVKQPFKRGDIHLKEGKHLAVDCGNGKIVHASINELGKTKGGKTGDQTGKEICIRQYYEYNGNWDCHLRYNVKSGSEGIDYDKLALEVYKGNYGNGDERRKRLAAMGADYNRVQSMVNAMIKAGKG